MLSTRQLRYGSHTITSDDRSFSRETVVVAGLLVDRPVARLAVLAAESAVVAGAECEDLFTVVSLRDDAEVLHRLRDVARNTSHAASSSSKSSSSKEPVVQSHSISHSTFGPERESNTFNACTFSTSGTSSTAIITWQSCANDEE